MGDGCSNFNIYGVEWTSSHIKFFLNGILKASFNNINIHKPMGLILNLAIGGCYGGCGWDYCGGLTWNYSSNCKVNCNTQFPSTYEIEWAKCWQKTNEAIYIKGVHELCVDDTYVFKAPNYPNATYEWTGTSGLNVTVLVKVENSCGISTNYSETTYLSKLNCWHPMKLLVFPNPSVATIFVEIIKSDEFENEIFDGNIIIRNKYGEILHSRSIETNLIEVNVLDYKSGIYYIIFENGETTISKSFLKIDWLNRKLNDNKSRLLLFHINSFCWFINANFNPGRYVFGWCNI